MGVINTGDFVGALVGVSAVGVIDIGDFVGAIVGVSAVGEALVHETSTKHKSKLVRQ